MPPGLCYAMFTWGSIGIVDRQSLMNIMGEAWVRNPTTIFKNSQRVTVAYGGRWGNAYRKQINSNNR